MRSRRGARAVEWDGLENRCGGNSTQGSNPCPSARESSVREDFRRAFTDKNSCAIMFSKRKDMITANNEVKNDASPINILLVEDNPADVLLTAEALREAMVPHDLSVVNNGADAIFFLKRQGRYEGSPRPNLILLDINLPKKNGFEVLADIKEDRDLKRIPVIVLTTSSSRQDILKAYDLRANCYIVKPIELDDFFRVIRDTEHFWSGIAKLP